jgi:hypothetical protein
MDASAGRNSLQRFATRLQPRHAPGHCTLRPFATLKRRANAAAIACMHLIQHLAALCNTVSNAECGLWNEEGSSNPASGFERLLVRPTHDDATVCGARGGCCMSA